MALSSPGHLPPACFATSSGRGARGTEQLRTLPWVTQPAGSSLSPGFWYESASPPALLCPGWGQLTLVPVPFPGVANDAHILSSANLGLRSGSHLCVSWLSVVLVAWIFLSKQGPCTGEASMVAIQGFTCCKTGSYLTVRCPTCETCCNWLGLSLSEEGPAAPRTTVFALVGGICCKCLTLTCHLLLGSDPFVPLHIPTSTRPWSTHGQNLLGKEGFFFW